MVGTSGGKPRWPAAKFIPPIMCWWQAALRPSCFTQSDPRRQNGETPDQALAGAAAIVDARQILGGMIAVM